MKNPIPLNGKTASIARNRKKSNKFDVDLVSRMMFTSRKISE